MQTQRLSRSEAEAFAATATKKLQRLVQTHDTFSRFYCPEVTCTPHRYSGFDVRITPTWHPDWDTADQDVNRVLEVLKHQGMIMVDAHGDPFTERSGKQWPKLFFANHAQLVEAVNRWPVPGMDPLEMPQPAAGKSR